MYDLMLLVFGEVLVTWQVLLVGLFEKVAMSSLLCIRKVLVRGSLF